MRAFNPSRLAAARKRRQLTKKALAEMASVSHVTLTRLETGKTTDPDASTLQSLSVALNYPIDFFFGDDLERLGRESVSFRSLSTVTTRQVDAALIAGSVAFVFAKWVGERFTLPSPDLPDLRGESPEGAAAGLRSQWGIGLRPLPNLNKLLEAKGVRIFSLSENNKNIDAYSCWFDGSPYVFLNTFKSAERSRFDAAHELGHLVMHGHGVSGRDVEREADAFAAAFLMPRDDLVAHVRRNPSVQYLIEAKQRWGVSLAALAYNCAAAGLISDWRYREMCKAISIAGYRSKEPNPMTREGSVLWRRVLEALWRDRVTKNQIASALSLPLDEIESMIGGLMGDGHQQDRARSNLRAV